jgi:hypothetical protein
MNGMQTGDVREETKEIFREKPMNDKALHSQNIP